MNEGEDPNTPIISDNNSLADNSDSMFSIRHDDEPLVGQSSTSFRRVLL
ncbi:MAG: hypothetical protein K6F57_00780 [Candidatus Saccharibacteria bacterium]|nr:hypothetical protein [Candidatus Saccharibacteria bacterium]